MLFVQIAKEFVKIQLSAFSAIDRCNTLIDFGTQPAQFFYMRQQLATDLFLIGRRQLRDFGNRLFKDFDHAALYYRIELSPISHQYRHSLIHSTSAFVTASGFSSVERCPLPGTITSRLFGMSAAISSESAGGVS